MDNKWKMFKNYLHNELGITKEDIQEWIKDAILDVADTYLKHQYSKKSLEDRIVHKMFSEFDYRDGFGRTARDIITSDVSRRVAARISIDVNEED